METKGKIMRTLWPKLLFASWLLFWVGNVDADERGCALPLRLIYCADSVNGKIEATGIVIRMASASRQDSGVGRRTDVVTAYEWAEQFWSAIKNENRAGFIDLMPKPGDSCECTESFSAEEYADGIMKAYEELRSFSVDRLFRFAGLNMFPTRLTLAATEFGERCVCIGIMDHGDRTHFDICSPSNPLVHVLLNSLQYSSHCGDQLVDSNLSKKKYRLAFGLDGFPADYFPVDLLFDAWISKEGLRLFDRGQAVFNQGDQTVPDGDIGTAISGYYGALECLRTIENADGFVKAHQFEEFLGRLSDDSREEFLSRTGGDYFGEVQRLQNLRARTMNIWCVIAAKPFYYIVYGTKELESQADFRFESIYVSPEGKISIVNLYWRTAIGGLFESQEFRDQLFGLVNE